MAEGPELRVIFENISGGLVTAGKVHGEMVFSRLSLKEYILYFKRQAPDILSLSEVHMEDENGNSEMVKKIASELNLPYYKCYAQSPSHLDTDKYLGLAVLSKYDIEDYFSFLLPNPELQVIKPDKSRWIMFNKGAQKLTLSVYGKRITIFNLHYFPFHHFYRRMNESEFSHIRAGLVDILLSDNRTPTIITGDFNNKGLPLQIAFPELFECNRFRQAVSTNTTVIGLHDEQFDHILYTPATLAVEGGFAEQNYSDHYAVIADFSFLC
jgi:endonuclease/exonuclease/phosphatase family metal-dependent hydrolase